MVRWSDGYIGKNDVEVSARDKVLHAADSFPPDGFPEVSTFAGLSDAVEELIEQAYWEFDARKKRPGMPQPERDAFKWAVRDLLHTWKSVTKG